MRSKLDRRSPRKKADSVTNPDSPRAGKPDSALDVDLAEFDRDSGLHTDWSPNAPFNGASLAYAPDGPLLYVGGESVFAVYR